MRGKFELSPWLEQQYRLTTRDTQGYALPTSHPHKHAFCEGCRKYIPMTNKVGITKGWRCKPCKKKTQGCCGGGT